MKTYKGDVQKLLNEILDSLNSDTLNLAEIKIIRDKENKYIYTIIGEYTKEWNGMSQVKFITCEDRIQ